MFDWHIKKVQILDTPIARAGRRLQKAVQKQLRGQLHEFTGLLFSFASIEKFKVKTQLFVISTSFGKHLLKHDKHKHNIMLGIKLFYCVLLRLKKMIAGSIFFEI